MNEKQQFKSLSNRAAEKIILCWGSEGLDSPNPQNLKNRDLHERGREEISFRHNHSEKVLLFLAK